MYKKCVNSVQSALSVKPDMLEMLETFFLFFAPHEHVFLKGSYCGLPMSVVPHASTFTLPCGRSRGHISCSINLKFGQNVCLDKISDESKFGLGKMKEIPCGHCRGNTLFELK